MFDVDVRASGSPFLTTDEAARFLRYRSASGIRNAVARGDLRPAGMGARGTHLFTVDELVRFAADRGGVRTVIRGEEPKTNAPARNVDALSRRLPGGRERLQDPSNR